MMSTISIPNQILCRVDIESEIWIFVGYSNQAKCWEKMNNEQELQRFLRQPHGLLKCPVQCLTQEQAEKVAKSAVRKIARLEAELDRFKKLLENAHIKHLDSPTNISSTVNIANKVTTGPSSGSSRQILDTRDRSACDLEAKLGTFASGLQSAFVSNITAIKRADSSDSVGSKNGTPRAAATAADPQSLQRSHSNSSIASLSGPYSGGKAAHKQSSVQQLKSMLRSKKPAVSSLDPYLTDSSEASSQPTPMPTAESTAVTLTESDTDGTPRMQSAVRTRSLPKLFGTDDDSCYWSDGSSICARLRDLEGGMSTDEAEYYSERSDSSRAPSPIDTGSAELGSKMRRISTYPGDNTSPAPDNTGGGIASMGIALADNNSNSRESIGTAHSAGSAGSSARLPKRSQSLDSVGSSSNGSAKGRATPSSTTAARTSPAQAALRNSPPVSLPGPRAGGGVPQYGEEDSRMSLQLSDDESRSMLFSQLRDDATSDSFYTHSYSYRRPDTGAACTCALSADNNSHSTSSGGIFGMVMSVAANYFPQMMHNSRSPAQACQPANAAVAPVIEAETGTNERLLQGGYISDTMLGEEDDDEATMVEPEYDLGDCADPRSLREPTLQSGAVDSSPIVASTVGAPEPPVLQLDYSKVSPEALATLSYFEAAVKKAKLGRTVQSVLLCCLVTKQVSPIDGAAHIAALLRKRFANTASISGTKKFSIDAKNNCDRASPALVLSTMDKLSKVLAKLFMRNKKIIVADALTVRTICAAGILHITLLLQVYSENPSLLQGDPLRTVVARVTESLERLVHMLNSLFLAAEDVPWLLEWTAHPCPAEEGIAHIEQYAHILTKKFSGSAVWPHVRDAVLRCDYTYQRNLISPVKLKPKESLQAEVDQKRVRKSKRKDDTAATRERKESEVSALPLFDILTCPSQQPASVCMLPPRSRASSLTGEPVSAVPTMPTSSAPATESAKASSTSSSTNTATAASEATTLLEKPKQPGHKTAMEELMQKSRKRKAAGSDALENSREETSRNGGERSEGNAKSAVHGAGMPASKRRNSLLSKSKPQPVGHRMSMGVQKHVVISAKTLAAAAAVSSKLSSVPAAASSKVVPALPSYALDDFTKTPRKGISWSPDTPFSSQHEDYQLLTQGSAMRQHVRNTTVIEGTPMEAPQFRRPFLISQQEAADHDHLADSLCSGRGMHSPEVRSNSRRRRAPSTSCSTACSSKSSSSGDSADHSKNNRLSCLFGTQDEEEEEDAAPSLLTRGGQHATRSFLSEDSFHYLPSLPSSQEENPADGDQFAL